ncbi:hypothetical protein LZ30DRAFT_719253 [Colletotrichum cereale]|nr:hypothetical protein LZ30DRAFT_719253 [Colletotrichum cereale]
MCDRAVAIPKTSKLHMPSAEPPSQFSQKQTRSITDTCSPRVPIPLQAEERRDPTPDSYCRPPTFPCSPR